VSLAARAGPPFLPPFRPRATAARSFFFAVFTAILILYVSGYTVAAFVRNRLASQARVFNAVYHLNSPLLRKAAGFATPGQTLESNSITVTGKVVDAACFMLYAAAASSASLRVRGCLCPLHASPAVCHVPAGSVPRNLRFGLPYHSHLSPNRQHRDAV
jgi:hypothetical protein